MTPTTLTLYLLLNAHPAPRQIAMPSMQACWVAAQQVVAQMPRARLLGWRCEPVSAGRGA